MSDLPRCRHCGEVIGVYEPLVALTDGKPRETSRALEPSDPNHPTDGICYHRACFERLAAQARQEPTRVATQRAQSSSVASEIPSDSRP